MRPDYETASGAPGALADEMGALSEALYGADWLGGLEHRLWQLYLRLLAGEPLDAHNQASPDPARLRRFGDLITAAGGIWTWPFDADGPTWAPLPAFLVRHERWLSTQRVVGPGANEPF